MIVFCEGFWKGICSTTIIYFNYIIVEPCMIQITIPMM